MAQEKDTPKPAAQTKEEQNELDVESLDFRKGGDGVTSLFSKGPVAFAALALVAVYGLIFVAPGLALPLAIAVGLALSGGVAWVAWALVTKRLQWSRVWKGSELRATRKKNGRFSLKGVGPIVWPLAGVLALLMLYMLAPDQAWGVWLGFFGGLAAAVVGGIVARRKGMLNAVQPAVEAEPSQPANA